MLVSKGWSQPEFFPALADLGQAEADRVIHRAWLEAWRAPWWRSPLPMKTMTLSVLQTIPLVLALVFLPLHYFLLIVGAEWVLFALLGNALYRALLGRDLARCIDRVLAVSRGDSEDAGRRTGPHADRRPGPVLRLLFPATRDLPPEEAMRLTLVASNRIGLRKPLRRATCWKLLILTIGGGVALIVIDRLTRPGLSPEIRSLVLLSEMFLWLGVGGMIYLDELNFHLKRIIAEETRNL